MGNISFEQNEPEKNGANSESGTVGANAVPRPLGKKKDVAAMLNRSIRSVDNFIAAGCPVLKLSPRCCRFDLDEVKKWFKDQYGQQARRDYKRMPTFTCQNEMKDKKQDSKSLTE